LFDPEKNAENKLIFPELLKNETCHDQFDVQQYKCVLCTLPLQDESSRHKWSLQRIGKNVYDAFTG